MREHGETNAHPPSPLSRGEGPGERSQATNAPAPSPLSRGEGPGVREHGETSAPTRPARPTILLATVKGDVHDIGKNIVGVVLSCNNYEIVDLGVMVPLQKILDEAQRLGVQIIGLSGLITPSLDEMVYVAREMEKRGMTTPLLIGGATTSKTHTAVKIEPEYSGPIVHVHDASRAVAVCSSLLSEDRKERERYLQGIKDEFERVRVHRAGQTQRKRSIPLTGARNNWLELDWSAYAPPVPARPGVHVWEDVDLRLLVDYIDWTPFFSSWQLAGKFPAILTDEVVGEESTKLYNDARSMLRRIIDEKWLRARAVFGIFPANTVDFDDIAVYSDESRTTELVRLNHLRQQSKKATGRPNLSADRLRGPGRERRGRLFGRVRRHGGHRHRGARGPFRGRTR